MQVDKYSIYLNMMQGSKTSGFTWKTPTFGPLVPGGKEGAPLLQKKEGQEGALEGLRAAPVATAVKPPSGLEGPLCSGHCGASIGPASLVPQQPPLQCRRPSTHPPRKHQGPNICIPRGVCPAMHTFTKRRQLSTRSRD